MKYFILVLIIIVSTPTLGTEWRKKCAEIGNLAEKIMIKRQSNILMQTMIESSEKDSIEELLIIEAFKTTGFYSTLKNKIIIDFSNKQYLKCVKLATKGNS